MKIENSDSRLLGRYLDWQEHEKNMEIYITHVMKI